MNDVKILIVEDEVLIALHLKSNLIKAGYTVVGPVVSGKAAIQIAQNENPDIILMDIRLMGDMDGIETSLKIKEFSSPGIIFNTGYEDANLKERAMALNPLAYLIKPVVWNDIDKVIHEWGSNVQPGLP